MFEKGFNWNLISKWREFLMGLGITGVMLGHLLEWCNAQGSVAYLFKPFVGLVFTEGFLLLSGLGLYYSFQKDNRIQSFYVKRIKRLLIPFIIISLPFYLDRAIVYGHSIGDFFLNIMTLHFWFKGNDGMWYISVSLLLYFIFPFLYKYIFKSKIQVGPRGFVVLFLFIIVCGIVYFLFPTYYELTGIGLTQMPMFAIGIIIGYLSYNSKQLKHGVLLILLLGVLVVITNIQEGIIGDLGNGLLRIFCIMLICALLSWMDNNLPKITYRIKVIFQWFGKYTLELYTLHLFIYQFVSRWLEPKWGGHFQLQYQSA